jgi:hypothetical protein
MPSRMGVDQVLHLCQSWLHSTETLVLKPGFAVAAIGD